MKKLALCLFAILIGKEAFADCNDKCVIRNPFSGNCAYEVRVCPLSVETIGRWVNGATKVDVQEHFKKMDPNYALRYMAKRLDIEVAIDQDISECVAQVATTGLFGTFCAVTVAELGALCFADINCTLSCVGTGNAFENTLKDCSIR